jgi:hypothetical protein
MPDVATSRNLIITRAGPKSLHERWLTPTAERGFDLLVASYDPDSRPTGAAGTFHRFIPGTKVQGWKATLSDNAALIGQYDFIALIDDDIDVDAASLTRLFEIGRDEGFTIFQPSLTWDSYFTYAGTVRNPLFAFRCVNYIEMMAPFFAASALQKVAPLFDYGWESGIDLVWGSALPPEDRRFAIVDAVPVRHTRPVGALKEANGFVNRNYESDIMASLAHFGMTWPSLVASEGKTAAGHWVGGFGLGLRALVLLALPFFSPSDMAVRKSFDHIRHQIFRRPGYSEDVRTIIAHDSAERRP